MDTGFSQLIDDVAPPLRYDDARHEYMDARTGEVLPHITGMLQAEKLIDDRWFTEESSERGSEVHRLTLDYDLEALDVGECRSKYRGWLLAYEATMKIVRPTWAHLEEPFVHRQLRFGGRPDRVGTVFGLLAVAELKTGGFHKSHLVQTALQAMLASETCHLPPEAIARFGFYFEDSGKFRVLQFEDPKDFRDATRIVRRHCRAV